MNKRLSVTFFFLLFLLVSTTVNAAPRVFLDGKELSFDVPPIIEDGRTLVPLRAIFSALGADVKWNSYTQTVTAVKDNTNIKLIIGGKAYINYQPVELDVPAKIVDGRTMVPLRFVTESLDCNVDWNKNTQTVLLTSKLQDKNILEAKPGYKIFENDEFSMRYPEKWGYRKISYESTEANIAFHYFYPENEINNGKSMICVNIDKLKNVLTLKQYTDLNILQAKELYNDFDMGKITDATLNGLPAKSISFTGKLGDIYLKQTVVFTVRGGKAYGVSLLEYNNPEPLLKEFEEAKISFIIK